MVARLKLPICYFFGLLLTLSSWSAFSQSAVEHNSNVHAQPLVQSTCSTEDGVDMCIFTGPKGNTSSIKIGTGLNYLWYGSAALNKIIRSTTTGGTKECTIPTGGASPFGVTLGPDKRMWFAEYAAGNVGAVTSACVVTEYPLGFSPSDSIDIKLGSDNNLWLSSDYNGIVRVTPEGVVTTFSLPDGNDAQPSALALGGDGNMWFLEANGPCFDGADYTNIGKVTPAGGITEYAVKLHGNGFGIAAGPDGRIWFADPGGCDGYTSRIGAISTSGTGLKYYSKGLPAYVDTIINGGDGNLYWGTFTSQIGRITTKGVATVWNLPSSPAFAVLGMTVGPDNNIWFSDNSGDYIGAVYIHPVIQSFAPTSGAVGATVTIKGFGFTGTTAVDFDGVAAKFTLVSGFEITTTVPSGAKTGKITVIDSGGTATSKSSFTVN
jgi:virginiamycin B lyase